MTADKSLIDVAASQTLAAPDIGTVPSSESG